MRCVWGSAASGEPYPHESPLAELGDDDGALLVLHEAPDGVPAASDRAATPRSDPARSLRPIQHACERSLSDRTARTLPDRLSRLARCRGAIRSLAQTPSRIEQPAARARPGSPALPPSLGPHVSRRCLEFATHGRKPTTSTSWWRCRQDEDQRAAWVAVGVSAQ